VPPRLREPDDCLERQRQGAVDVHGRANIRITLDQYGLPLQGAEDEAAGLLDAFLAATSADGLSRLCRTLPNPD
jgi:hypothetical protein